MDEDRLILHNLLLGLFPTLKLYFRPPSKIILEYPCIVYDRIDIQANHSNNTVYNDGSVYRITLMSNLPGYTETKKLLRLPNSTFVTSYTVDDIVHEIFNAGINTI